LSHEIISVAQMRAIDAAAAQAGTPTRQLMENAGRAVADAIAQRFTPRPLAVLCGPGNHGGDGWVAARVLRALGWPVWVETLIDVTALKGDAADAAAAWEGETYALGEDNPMADLFIDALFGAGLTRALEGDCARLARALAPERVIAVDIASGLDGDTGKPIGDAWFRAGLTVTFARKKAAHVLEPGRSQCGEVVLADIGIGDDIIASQNVTLRESAWDLWRAAFPWPDIAAHKHARGDVIVASGGRGRTGAARLAARGALRIGAGLVSVLSPGDAMAENAAQLTAIMLREAGEGACARAAREAGACVIGPAFGLEKAQRNELNAAIGADPRAPLVLDADALTLLAQDKRALDPRDVLTPHVGEFKRLFPDLLEQSASRIVAAQAASRGMGCVIVLKGPDTVTAAPDGRAVVNSSGTPFLATAGSGDVLAGFIAGLIAQGMASFEAASLAVWLHGRCGQALGPGLVAEDLPESLPRVLNGLAPARWRGAGFAAYGG
jgi:hydroxyethylthiazole kinase-like uncharacterized protein yjeF